MKIAATHTAIARASKVAGFHSIEGHRGLYLRVTAAGSRSWMFRTKVGGVAAWENLGDAATVEAADAIEMAATRRKAALAATKVARATGEAATNPIAAERARKREEAAEKRAKAQAAALRVTLDDWAARWLSVPVSAARRRQGPKRAAAYDQATYDRWIKPRLGALKVEDITARQVSALRDAIPAPSAKRKAVRVLSALLSHAKSDGLVGINVALGVRVPPPGQRARVLDADRDADGAWTAPRNEIAKLWHAAAVPGVRAATLAAAKVILATGQRPGEVLQMRWADLRDHDGEIHWLIPGSLAKNGRSHLVPLPPQVRALIESQREPEDTPAEDRSPYVFRPWAKAKIKAGEPVATSDFVHSFHRLREALGIPHCTPHDLRRTCATKLAMLKTPPHVVEAVLNHASGFRAGVAGVYNQHPYTREIRAALRSWARYLDATRRDAVPSNVVELAAREVKA